MMDIKPLAGIVYLKCEPTVCAKRIQKRNRSEECGIPLEYLNLLHAKHEEWLNSRKDERVLVLDVSEDMKVEERSYTELVEKVREFLQTVIS